MNAPAIPGLQVRPIRLEDAGAWARYVLRPEVLRFTSSTASCVDDLLPMLQRMAAGGPDAPLRWVLTPDGGDAIVASVGFHTISTLNGTAEITYDVDPVCWGRGIATTACRAATRWGFEVRGWHRIQATTMLPHVASQCVLERCGYRREGVVRHFRVVRGVPTDYWMYSVLPDEVHGAG